MYFEVDGQTIIAPTTKSIGVPQTYDFSVSFKEFITNEAIWNIVDLSGSIIFEAITSEIGISFVEGITESVWESSESLLKVGNEVTSEIVSGGAEIGTEALGGMLELMLEFIGEFLGGLLG